EGDALGVAGLRPRRCTGHAPSIARRSAQQSPACLYAAAGMDPTPTTPPGWTQAPEAGQVRLQGDWILDHALEMAARLREIPGDVASVDASGVGRIDSAGMMQLARFARRRELADDALHFSESHLPLVQLIED